DDAHPQANLDKMAAGIALTDDDRLGWLNSLKHSLQQHAAEKRSVVLTCSSLKRRYRDLLRQADAQLFFVHLHGDRALIAERMRSRERHFMPLVLLDSQLADLEPLQQDEQGVVLDIRHTPEQLAEQAALALAGNG